MFVNNDIRKEMYKGADANVDAQFKKLFIYHMENVSILFADIKVSERSLYRCYAYIPYPYYTQFLYTLYYLLNDIINCLA